MLQENEDSDTRKDKECRNKSMRFHNSQFKKNNHIITQEISLTDKLAAAQTENTNINRRAKPWWEKRHLNQELRTLPRPLC
ncbi:hypothetical protein CEXT_407481 [Caerostris extrusa]|uniref:Uncharacterized protein n=1 Tax=Caerostris extrusa TaxID=172846 RepID=A0AAV4QXJ7_CAEEX|nr:hypothetical protein CEXT_407481 [Caerostris extrusa]